MSDLISRQAAIEYLMTNMNWYDEDGYESDDDYKRECITELINGVPSVTPERKTGKWINGYCSDCGKHAPFWAMATTYYKSSFCPNCGARMDKEESKC